MDIKALMNMAQKMQSQLTEAQSDAAKILHTGEAGAGMVRVVLNGRYEAVEVKIEPAATQDVALLEDLLRAAFNQASTKVAGGLQESLGGVAKGAGIDLSSIMSSFTPKDP